MLYRVLGQPVVGSKGILDHRLVSVEETCGRVVSSKTSKYVNWYELTLMEEPSKTSYQSASEVVGMSSSSEGETTTTTYLMGSDIDPGGDTSLFKREC